MMSHYSIKFSSFSPWGVTIFLGMFLSLFHCDLSLNILSRWKLGSCIGCHSWISISSVALEVRILHLKPVIFYIVIIVEASIHLQPFMKSHFHFPIFVESAEYQVISSVVRTSDMLRVILVSKSWLVLKNKMFGYRLPLVPSMSSGGLKAASANCWQPCHLHVSIV